MNPIRLFDWLEEHRQAIVRVAVPLLVLLLVGVYLFVYATGGIKYVFSHSMYVPILLAGFLFGLKGGIVFGLLGGLTLGPFMPIDVSTGEPQETINWIYRTGFFVLIGFLSGWASDSFRSYTDHLKSLSRDLREANREMEQRVEERTAELSAAMEQARAADRLKSAFLATMSHELRTPLNAIIGFTGILLQGLAGPLNEEQRKQMSMVQTSGRHLLNLINDVLDISKIEAGELKLSRETFDLKPSLEKTAALVSPMANQKGLKIEVDLPDSLGAATTDQRRLEQIALNLLNNAVKFTEAGRVTLSCRLDQGFFHLTVSDTGIGMTSDEVRDIFKPFHQVDTGLSRKYEGTGLGLAICKRIADLMGGSIDVASLPGEGSSFTLRFPKDPEPQHE